MHRIYNRFNCTVFIRLLALHPTIHAYFNVVPQYHLYPSFLPSIRRGVVIVCIDAFKIWPLNSSKPNGADCFNILSLPEFTDEFTDVASREQTCVLQCTQIIVARYILRHCRCRLIGVIDWLARPGLSRTRSQVRNKHTFALAIACNFSASCLILSIPRSLGIEWDRPWISTSSMKEATSARDVLTSARICGGNLVVL